MLLVGAGDVPADYRDAIDRAEVHPSSDRRAELLQCVRHWDFFRTRRAYVWRRAKELGLSARPGFALIEIGNPNSLTYAVAVFVKDEQVLGLGSGEARDTRKIKRPVPDELAQVVDGEVEARGVASFPAHDADCYFLAMVTVRGPIQWAVYGRGPQGSVAWKVIQPLAAYAEAMEVSDVVDTPGVVP